MRKRKAWGDWMLCIRVAKSSARTRPVITFGELCSLCYGKINCFTVAI